uniref:EF hand family protein n=4 Tax=Oryza TaxID=4527 RepID=Q2QXW5_ORYSJ|nr:EF hand family protein [Oryza sativa Japonica Group]
MGWLPLISEPPGPLFQAPEKRENGDRVDWVFCNAVRHVDDWVRVAKCDDKDARYEDCEKMIHVFDKDGDGRIRLDEFRAV